MCWVLNTFSCTTFRRNCFSFGFLRVLSECQSQMMRVFGTVVGVQAYCLPTKWAG